LPGANTGGTSGNVFWLTLGALNPGFWLGFWACPSEGTMNQTWLLLPWTAHWIIAVPGLVRPSKMSNPLPQNVFKINAFPANCPAVSLTISKKLLWCWLLSIARGAPSLFASFDTKIAAFVSVLTKAYLPLFP
jgi:hypothetical protein